MPSFRASVAVCRTHTGVSPPTVLEAARAGVATRWHVEDAFVDASALLRNGLPRVMIRFVVAASHDEAEDAEARAAAKAMAAQVGKIADWQALTVFRRVKGRWVNLSDL